jgi:hypothetical protein
LPARPAERAGEVRPQGWAQREGEAAVGGKPLEGRLLTQREAVTIDAAAQLIEGYRARGERERL